MEVRVSFTQGIGRGADADIRMHGYMQLSRPSVVKLEGLKVMACTDKQGSATALPACYVLAYSPLVSWCCACRADISAYLSTAKNIEYRPKSYDLVILRKSRLS